MSHSESSGHNHPSRHIERAEHQILEHVTHHGLSEVYKELHQLRAYDAKHGRNFHKDLQEINRLLHNDLAKKHLPKMTIEERGTEFTVKPEGRSRKQNPRTAAEMPVVARRAIEAESRQYHAHGPRRKGQGRFIGPREMPEGDAADEAGQHAGDARSLTPGDASPSGQRVEPGAKSPSQTGFGEKLLRRLNLPVTPENLKFLDAWQRAEGGSADNPFNTTQNAPGASRFNSIGVKRYPSIDVGVEATAQTLSNVLYEPILAALRNGQNAHTTAVAVAHTPWGTHDGVARLV